MKKRLTQNRLITILSGICLLIPVAYAEPDVGDLISSKQIENFYPTTKPSNDTVVNQVGDNNYANIGVSGKSNQIGLIQNGNKNNGEIQVNGDSNKVTASQNGDGLNFGLTVTGSNMPGVTVTQHKP